MSDEPRRLSDKVIERLRREYEWRVQQNREDLPVRHTLRRFGEIIATFDALKAERDALAAEKAKVAPVLEAAELVYRHPFDLQIAHLCKVVGTWKGEK
jgi:hypothetical protein